MFKHVTIHGIIGLSLLYLGSFSLEASAQALRLNLNLCDKKIQLRSWKGDFLHRPDSEQGVTTWNTGRGNVWRVDCVNQNQIKLQSWKGDFLHRPDSEQGVTTWDTGQGNVWNVEYTPNGELQLQSWKGDYLHRPDSNQGVTTWGGGRGNVWVIVPTQ